MRVKRESKNDYGAISRRSMQRDFQRVRQKIGPKRITHMDDIPEYSERRIIFVGENSQYYKYRRFLIGKLVRLKRQSTIGGWICEFVYDDDRVALNMNAGWSDNKREYLFDGCKFNE